jgi:hypothetical protein
MARDRRRHAQDGEVPTAPLDAAAMPSKDPIPGAQAEPHPSLIAIARLLARQAANADLAAQRIANLKD